MVSLCKLSLCGKGVQHIVIGDHTYLWHTSCIVMNCVLYSFVVTSVSTYLLKYLLYWVLYVLFVKHGSIWEITLYVFYEKEVGLTYLIWTMINNAVIGDTCVPWKILLCVMVLWMKVWMAIHKSHIYRHTVEQPELQQPLTRKYSYLEAQQRFSPTKGNCMVKPASHCTAGNVEKPVEKQLTTAGSIYALYNSFYGDEECKTPGKMDNNKRNPYSTMPRKRKRMGATPDMRPRFESDRNWN